MLKQRIITALVLFIALVLATYFLPPFHYSLALAVVVLLAGREWSSLIGLESAGSSSAYLLSLAIMLAGLYPLLGVTPTVGAIDSLRVMMILLLGFGFWCLAMLMLRGYPDNAQHWNDKSLIATMSIFVLLPTWVGIVQLKYLLPEGYLIIALVVLVAVVDIGGYFVGRSLGHTKLAPQLSPKKTWEGVWGGLVACVCVGAGLVWALHNFLQPLTQFQVIALIGLSLSVTLFDVIGDLTESMLKRNRHIKDSGSLLPGHGGIMDRVDGLVAVIPIYVMTLLLLIPELR